MNWAKHSTTLPLTGIDLSNDTVVNTPDTNPLIRLSGEPIPKNFFLTPRTNARELIA